MPATGFKLQHPAVIHILAVGHLPNVFQSTCTTHRWMGWDYSPPRCIQQAAEARVAVADQGRRGQSAQRADLGSALVGGSAGVGRRWVKMMWRLLVLGVGGGMWVIWRGIGLGASETCLVHMVTRSP